MSEIVCVPHLCTAHSREYLGRQPYVHVRFNALRTSTGGAWSDGRARRRVEQSRNNNERRPHAHRSRLIRLRVPVCWVRGAFDALGEPK